MRPENGASQPLPSPNTLKNKYLLRGKKLRSEQGPDQKFDQDNDEAIQVNTGIENTIKLDPEFSLLISLPSVKLSQNVFKDIDERWFLFLLIIMGTKQVQTLIILSLSAKYFFFFDNLQTVILESIKILRLLKA